MVKLNIEGITLKIKGSGSAGLDGQKIIFDNDGIRLLGDNQKILDINSSIIEYIQYEYNLFKSKLLKKSPSEIVD